jgi:hypothetical protein
MTLGQQWAIVLAILWSASIWAAYSVGTIRGEAKGLQWAVDLSRK